jgi:drug/metabolite transporter (DMT)-like permease
LKSVPAPLAAMLTLLEPILLPIWVFVAWGRNADYQPPSWWTCLGGTLILLGLVEKAMRSDERQDALGEIDLSGK